MLIESGSDRRWTPSVSPPPLVCFLRPPRVTQQLIVAGRTYTCRTARAHAAARCVREPAGLMRVLMAAGPICTRLTSGLDSLHCAVSRRRARRAACWSRVRAIPAHSAAHPSHPHAAGRPSREKNAGADTGLPSPKLTALPHAAPPALVPRLTACLCAWRAASRRRSGCRPSEARPRGQVGARPRAPLGNRA